MENTTFYKNTSGFKEVYAIKPFRALWFGQVCSQLAVSILIFVLALRVYQLTGSNAAVSGLFLFYGIPAVLFGLIAGTLVDHLDKRKVLFICDVTRAIVVLSFLVLPHDIFIIYTLVFLLAAITQFYVPSEAPTIPRLVPADHLVTANSLFSFTYYSSLALGSILAGPVLRLVGLNGAIILISLFFTLAASNVRRVPPEAKREFTALKITQIPFYQKLLEKVLRELHFGVTYVLKSRMLRDALLLLTGTQIIVALLGTLGPGFADRVLEIDVRDASLVIIGPIVIGIIAGAFWVGNFGYHLESKKLIQRGITWAGLILMLISITVRLKRVSGFAWFSNDLVLFPLEFILFLLLGIANALLDVPANTILLREAEGELRGRVYGVMTSLVGGVGILPIILGGVLADVIGVGKVMFLLGIGIFSYGLLRIRYNRT